MKINESGVETPWILVPPYNAIGPEQIVQLSKHFKVICGGPETARFTERIIGPIAISGTWYFPSFHLFMGAPDHPEIGLLNSHLQGLVCLTLHFRMKPGMISEPGEVLNLFPTSRFLGIIKFHSGG